MKKTMIAIAFLFSVAVFAQKLAPKHEIVGNLVQSTYYYDNGQVSQKGFYKNGKVHGQWTSFDIAGNKTSMGSFENGAKAGKWFFWANKNLSEVDYSDSRIAAVKSWKQDAIAKN